MGNLKLVHNDIFNIGITSQGATGFGVFVLVLLTIFVLIAMCLVTNFIHGKEMDKGDGFFSYILMFLFSVVGFFIFPSSSVCIHGPLLGFLLGFIFSYESHRRAKITKWWNVKTCDIDAKFQKYRTTPKVLLFLAIVFIILAAIYLPQDLWTKKYHAIAICAAVLSNIISAEKSSI